jgi:hypothetical protein
MVGWTNVATTHFIFLPPKCGSNLLFFVHYGIVKWDSFWNYRLQYLCKKLIGKQNI